MKNFPQMLAPLCFCMGLTGCASLTMERQQAFAVQTHHGDVERTGIDCDLRNDTGTWSLTSPASVEVHKSAENLLVECKEGHLSGKASVKSTVNAAYASNFLFLFGIGYLIDKYTGAGFDYPETVVVQLGGTDELASRPAPFTSNAR